MPQNAGHIARETLEYLLEYRNHTFVFAPTGAMKLKPAEMGALFKRLNLLSEAGITLVLAEFESLPVWTRSRAVPKHYTILSMKSDEKFVAAVAKTQPSKLCFLSDVDVLLSNDKPISSASESQARQLLQSGSCDDDTRRLLQLAADATAAGVPRVQFFNVHKSDALFQELFTEYGAGTMVYGDDILYKQVRFARPDDALVIWELLNSSGIEKTPEDIQASEYIVFEVDDEVLGCVRVETQTHYKILRNIVCSPYFDETETVRAMLEDAILQARRLHALKILIPCEEITETVTNEPWFDEELGFLLQRCSKQNDGKPAWTRYLS